MTKTRNNHYVPQWYQERSIRERNLMLMNGITKILGITMEHKWRAQSFPARPVSRSRRLAVRAPSHRTLPGFDKDQTP